MDFIRSLFDPSQLMSQLTTMLYTLPGILLGLTLHELAHAFAADRLGDPTPRSMGRLSLNPLRHIDPIGFLMLLIAGFGWAKPVVTNPNYYRRKRFGFAIVGLAGPITNLILGFLLLFLGYGLVYGAGVTGDEVGMQILWLAVNINFALFIFNLLPVPPLDGFGILKDTVLLKYANSPLLWKIEQYAPLLLLALLFTNVAGNVISFVVEKLWTVGALVVGLFL